MAPITINGNTLDPARQTAALSAFGLETEDASKSNYILVQTSTFLSPEQQEEFDRLNIVIHEYVSENTYLCGYKPSDLQAIRSLPYVTWANVYLKHFVVSSALKAQPTTSVSAIVPSLSMPAPTRVQHVVDVVLHEDIDSNSTDVISTIARVAHVDGDLLRIHRDKIRLKVEEQDLDRLASLDAVRSIREVYPLQLFNNVARKIVHADVSLNGTAYQGSGQIVAVADTGVDESHEAFIDRFVNLYGLSRGGKTDDPDGHGTHVCGSVLGSGTSETMGGLIQGTAPQASLVIQSVLDEMGGLGGIPTNLYQLFEQPYEKDGARVHTNSWGSQASFQLPYDQSSTDIDRFVWENEDMVILFAAGNAGVDRNSNGIIDLAQIGSQAAAKNCITVGASENDRPNLTTTYGDFNAFQMKFPVPPIVNDLLADNPQGMAAFSSRGPTREGRIKPDLVAPGTGILSAHSRLAEPREIYGVSSDPKWAFMAGTSQATPLVAGAAAVIRQALIDNGLDRPSSAVVKALLINGAVDLLGQYTPSEAGPSPNPNSGWGRMHIANSVVSPRTDRAGFGEGGPIAQGKEDTIRIRVPRSREELLEQDGDDPEPSAAGKKRRTARGFTFKYTLVWIDFPGAMLQNDLDLIVRAADGQERHGNMGTRQDFDRTNNVEQVRWTKVPDGDLEIIIRAARITRGQQRYAYAWRFD